MKSVTVVAVVCILAVPAVAGPITYTFDVSDGLFALSFPGVGSTTVGIGGTFALTVYGDGSLGASNTFMLEDGNPAPPHGAGLSNTSEGTLSVGGFVTARLLPGSGQFLDFIPAAPGHIGSDGQATMDTDAYVQATVIITGAFTTTFHTAVTGDMSLNMGFSTSPSSDPNWLIGTVTLDGTFSYELGLSITADLMIEVVGTAHVVPDPALGGLTALGLGGAGTWLHRRRAMGAT
jgi:hypothetical protein